MDRTLVVLTYPLPAAPKGPWSSTQTSLPPSRLFDGSDGQVALQSTPSGYWLGPGRLSVSSSLGIYLHLQAPTSTSRLFSLHLPPDPTLSSVTLCHPHLPLSSNISTASSQKPYSTRKRHRDAGPLRLPTHRIRPVISTAIHIAVELRHLLRLIYRIDSHKPSMPRASPPNDALDPVSPHAYPFSSCPDNDDSQIHSQPHHQYSSRPMVPTIMAPSIADDAERQRSTVLLPETQSEVNRNVDIHHGPGRMRDVRRDTDEAHKQRTETDNETPGAASDSARAVYLERSNRAIMSNRIPSTTTNRVPTVTSNIRPCSDHGLNRNRKQDDERAAHSAITLDQVEEVDLAGNDEAWVHDYGLAGLSYEYCQTRLTPSTPSSFLRPGSKFSGMQKSERSRYDVEVEIKHVDLRESFLCGYLRIQGLTDTHPTLTTYFEGEIIGPHYSFLTQHPQWGANDKIDISHWRKFDEFKPYARAAPRGGVQIRDVASKPDIFMRWKEQFLVPNHRVKTINGASFEGFYYICFSQVKGTIQGIYFHSKSEKFQQLALKHVEDRGCFGSMEFR